MGQARTETRVLAYSGDILPDNASFLLANSVFTSSYPELVRDLVEGSAEAGGWAKAHLDDVTATLAEATRIDANILAEVNARAGFDVVPLSEPALARQQKTADRLTRLGVVPRQIWSAISFGVRRRDDEGRPGLCDQDDSRWRSDRFVPL
jgi:sulfonate transport system substrate-binding protein